MRLDLQFIRRGIVLFWALWFAVVFASNLCDGLRHLQLLPVTWTFSSGNYRFMELVTGRHDVTFLTPFLFIGVVVWEAVAVIAFGRAAWLSGETTDRAIGARHAAFAIGLALWAAFVLADEVFIVYDVEASHLRLFTTQLASLLFLELVPAQGCSNSGC